MKNVQVYYAYVKEDDWKLFVAATSKGLCYVSTQINSEIAAVDQLQKYMKHFSLEEDRELMQPYVDEIVAYIDGKLRVFSAPIDLHGTVFQRSVWQALIEIPYAEVATYSEIAERINRPKAVRAVGSAIGKNPLLIVVPCHRVIRKNGELSGFREGTHMKKKLLQLENQTQTVE